MNLPNKLTISRIIISIIIIFILLFPFDSMGINIPDFYINEQLVVHLEYLIAGVLFVIGSLTDFLDGYIARKYNLITDFGKLIDAIADKMLVNSVLIILASTGTISAIVPVVVILRDTVVNSIKMLAASKGKVVAAIKSGKYKTACLMIGVTLTLFYNLPFELFNLKVADFFLLVATILSLVSGVQYYFLNQNIIFDNKE
ncbi:MAG: CDP-diacylglycerol--glycerol-3-phosphate 3-phosphatidyltransferase [Bacilli bacterium]|jgi:CDP-diacylglycerol--glycerol-3-phosphate 3-phosphatidyltransferase|nr:CDP-diacylglycerol--glycerol-3-phosphate 3-phosphatidyltransferase [Bacilli bacterium]